ncbi:hypothetical protein [Legionella adelaidensis]|uniref:hypothetical protein n=1 Tax=Legionella adelaidensis TaxID=45056 RepID=UPI0010413A8E|nr:hypothetical protein [Legionella adelaidensis]
MANRVALGAAASVGISYIFNPLKTAVYGVVGAMQGAIGVMALSTFGFSTCSIATAATIGALAGAAIAAPFAIGMGVLGILGATEGNDMGPTLLRFSLNVGIMLLASFVMSTSLMLGTLPVAAVTTGAVIYELAKEGAALII